MKADRARTPAEKPSAKAAVPTATGSARSQAESALDGVAEDASLTTGEMARLSNNTLRTVRFYEEAGILTPLGRTDGGHRLFGRVELERLMLVSDMREAGLSLDEIRCLLTSKSAAASGGEAAQRATTALGAHIASLQAKMAVLARLADDLQRTLEAATDCVGCNEEQLFPDHCADCERQDHTTPQPRAMRVLWSLGKPSGRRSTASSAK